MPAIVRRRRFYAIYLKCECVERQFIRSAFVLCPRNSIFVHSKISSRLHSFPYSLVQNIKIHWISFLHHSYCKTNINSTVIIWKDIQMWEFISRCQCISVSVFSSWVCLSRFQIYIHTYHTHTAHESTAFHLIITSECLIALKIILCIANSSIFKHSKWLNGKWQI